MKTLQKNHCPRCKKNQETIIDKSRVYCVNCKDYLGFLLGKFTKGTGVKIKETGLIGTVELKRKKGGNIEYGVVHIKGATWYRYEELELI